MSNFLIGTVLVAATLTFVLVLIGASLMLGRLFTDAVQHLAPTQPTRGPHRIR